tara:strand:+ start:186 stop:368 length:183 start_codon:yes stop_codon:yes gene_type:complete
MNTLQISVEKNLVISRFNGEGEGRVACSFVSEDQVATIITNHNKCEELNPSKANAKAVRV